MARRKLHLELTQIDQIKTMAGLGLKVEQMAAILGMSKKTFERRMKDTPGANDALEKGRATASFQVTKKAYEMAVDGKHPVMTIFWLKVRENWKETQVLEHTGKDGEPLSFTQLAYEASRRDGKK